jgi:hypothetical protein
MAHATLAGLESYTYPNTIAGPYVIEGKLQIPMLSQGGGQSSVVATVTQNSTTVFTSVAGSTGFKCEVLCATGDTLTVALTSAAAADQPVNAIQATLNFTMGVS